MKIIKFFHIIMLLLLIFSGCKTNLSGDKTQIITVSPTIEQLYNEGYQSVEIGNKIVMYQPRVINGAIVEGDSKIQIFEKTTSKFIEQKGHWRSDLPRNIPSPKITKQDAEKIAGGQVLFSDLWIISPDSVVFVIKPVPLNPVWAVNQKVGDSYQISLIDSVTGINIGQGIPPPSGGISMSGPQYYIGGCSSPWRAWYQSAQGFFLQMGYDVRAYELPVQDIVKAAINSSNVSVFYEIGHGSYMGYIIGCEQSVPEDIAYFEVEQWIHNSPKMPFTFLASCDALSISYPGSIAYNFRKGSDQKAVVVGYSGMSLPRCSSCWTESLNWQNTLFAFLATGYDVGTAFQISMLAYPQCITCMKTEGDTSIKLIPKLLRSYCGDGFCDNTENCHNCGSDCGTCPVGSPIFIKQQPATQSS
ncbi:MAG: hypothetical protein V1735_00005 [Nanoarchaeota archaeon]